MSKVRFIRFSSLVLFVALAIAITPGLATSNILSPGAPGSKIVSEPTALSSPNPAWFGWEIGCDLEDPQNWGNGTFSCNLFVEWGQGSVVGQASQYSGNVEIPCIIVGNVQPGGKFAGGYLECTVPSIIDEVAAHNYPHSSSTGYETFPDLLVELKTVSWNKADSQPYFHPTYGAITPIMTHPSIQMGIGSKNGQLGFETIYWDQLASTTFSSRMSHYIETVCLWDLPCDWIKFELAPNEAFWNNILTGQYWRGATYAWWVEEAPFYIGYDPLTGSKFWGQIDSILIDPQKAQIGG